MAKYKTGVINSAAEFIDVAVAFLAENGFATNQYGSEGLGKRAHLSKNGLFVNLRSSTGEGSTALNTKGSTIAGILINVGTGYSAAAAWNAQPGVPLATDGKPSYAVSPMATTGMRYYLFLDAADNFIGIVEVAAGVFGHVCFGTLKKFGDWVGGAYFGANSAGYFNQASTVPTGTTKPSAGAYSMFVRADVSAFTGKWLANSTGTVVNNGYTGRGSVSTAQSISGAVNYALLLSKTVSSTSGQLHLLPIRLMAQTDNSGYAFLGEIPGIYEHTATPAGYAYGGEYQLGNDTYLVFPGFSVKKTT